jgi:hypothetical protein
MSSLERLDDFEMRRAHLESMSDEELHTYFWDLVDQIVAPLIEEARTHTTPSIERSVLLRMGFSSIDNLLNNCTNTGCWAKVRDVLYLNWQRIKALQYAKQARLCYMVCIGGSLIREAGSGQKARYPGSPQGPG